MRFFISEIRTNAISGILSLLWSLPGSLLWCLLGLCVLGTATGWSNEIPKLNDTEVELWRLAEREQEAFEQTVTLFQHEKTGTYLREIASRLWQQVNTNLPPVEIRTFEDPYLKAFAYPNGIIYLSTGMLIHTQNEDQLAILIAHEMVHYLQRHALSAFGHVQQPEAPPSNIDSAFQYTADHHSHAADMLALNAAEKQADQEGLALVKAAGYRPQEMVNMLVHFQRIEKQMGTAGGLWENGARQLRMKWIQGVVGSEIVAEAGVPNETAAAAHQVRIAPARLADAKAGIRLGLWDQALASLDVYSELIHNDPLAFFLKGKIHEQGWTDHSEAAEKAYLKAIELNRDFASAYLALGMINYKAGKRRTARDHFTTGLALAPQSRERAYIRGYLQKCSD